jgi:hypothetical protein
MLNVDVPVEINAGSALDVLDATGRVLRYSLAKRGVQTVEVGDLPAGAYTLSLSGKGIVRTAPFIKH